MNSHNFVLTADSTVDLSPTWLKKNNIEIMHLPYTINDITYLKGELPSAELFAFVRKGVLPTTSQVNPEIAKDVLDPILASGKDVLHIGFSSGLSGSVNSIRNAAKELLEKYPDRKVTVIDTLSASSGEGMLLYFANEMYKQNKSMEEIEKWIEDNKLHLCHYVVVDDLNHLQRGGRISKTSAFFGTMMGVKPIIHVDNTGKLVPIDKKRGRKTAILHILDVMEEKTKNYPYKNEVVFISNADCKEDAEFLKEEITKRLGITNIVISDIGPVISSHAGAGTLALFFLGESR